VPAGRRRGRQDVYTWIWRHLPGGTGSKALLSLLLVLAVSAVLLFLVFPWIEPLVPFTDVTVDH
jgi:hypothetical protein